MLRFFNERDIAARVSHPGVVQVFDAGYHDERPYLVLERLDGCLAARATSLAQLVPLMAQVAEALAALHAAGVVHRDITPRNLLFAPPLAPEGRGRPDAGAPAQRDESALRLKVADLGLAKTAPGAALPLSTALTAVLGAME